MIAVLTSAVALLGGVVGYYVALRFIGDAFCRGIDVNSTSPCNRIALLGELGGGLIALRLFFRYSHQLAQPKS